MNSSVLKNGYQLVYMLASNPEISHSAECLVNPRNDKSPSHSAKWPVNLRNDEDVRQSADWLQSIHGMTDNLRHFAKWLKQCENFADWLQSIRVMTGYFRHFAKWLSNMLSSWNQNIVINIRNVLFCLLLFILILLCCYLFGLSNYRLFVPDNCCSVQ